MLKILILAALPNEYACFRKMTPRWRLMIDKPYRTFSFLLPEKQITLIETGMGGNFAADALEKALACSRPDFVISMGFGGGLHESLAVGDVCATTHAMEHQGESKPEKRFAFVFSDDLSAFLAAKKIAMVTAVTVAAPPDKPRLSALLADGKGTVDMETAIIADIARERGIPFMCLRAISDGLHDELGFDLKDITGETGEVVVAKVLKTILFNPAVVIAFYWSWRRSSTAANNLGRILSDFLDLPVSTLKRIAAGTRVEAA
ncbi:MAG: hypothetical protein ABFD97_22710 [Syntrophobacter sp.]